LGGGANFRGASGAVGPRFSGGGGNWQGGGGWHRGYHRRGGGFFPGAVAGAVVGGALASGYYGSGYDYGYGSDYGYYDDPYSYDDAVVAAAPAPVGGDDVAYCMQTYRSYDPASGTYLGYDGQRHPCP
jgi:hypothetical protein